jgi:adenosylhomocysteine nucleosidase
VTRVAIIAAMAGELKPLVRSWQRERRNGVELWRWRFDEGEWVAACAGAGVGAATRAFAEIEKDGAIDLVFSVGWAGALSEELEAGRAYWVSGVIDVRTGERFATGIRDQGSGICGPVGNGEFGDPHPSDNNKDVARVGHPAQADLPPRSQNRDLGHPDILLVTSPRVADEAEKRRLAAAYGAGLVDMEAAGVARLAAMRGIPFYCVKGVSDGFREKLPDFNRFILPEGRFQLGRFAVFCILRPWYWPSLIRMGENSSKASQSVRESLLDFLDERATIRERNGYPGLKR